MADISANELIKKQTGLENPTGSDISSFLRQKGYTGRDARKMGKAYDRLVERGRDVKLFDDGTFDVTENGKLVEGGSARNAGKSVQLSAGDLLGLGRSVSKLAGSMAEISQREQAPPDGAFAPGRRTERDGTPFTTEPTIFAPNAEFDKPFKSAEELMAERTGGSTNKGKTATITKETPSVKAQELVKGIVDGKGDMIEVGTGDNKRLVKRSEVEAELARRKAAGTTTVDSKETGLTREQKIAARDTKVKEDWAWLWEPLKQAFTEPQFRNVDVTQNQLFMGEVLPKKPNVNTERFRTEGLGLTLGRPDSVSAQNMKPVQTKSTGIVANDLLLAANKLKEEMTTADRKKSQSQVSIKTLDAQIKKAKDPKVLQTLLEQRDRIISELK